MHDLDSLYELCLKVRKDPEKCSLGARIMELMDVLGLEECVQKNAEDDCFERCVKGCGGGELCMKACRTAVDGAVAKGLTKDILKGALEMVLESNLMISMPEAAAVLVSNLLEKRIDGDCAARTRLFNVMSIVVVDLRNLIGPDLILLLAPLISATYDCVGEEADGLLEEIKNVAGEKEVEGVSAALDSGEVAIRRVTIRFPPVR